MALSRLRFAYRRGGPTVIRELSWEVPHGRKVVLLGPNGAGKSTLLSLAADVLTPAAGAPTSTTCGAYALASQAAVGSANSWTAPLAAALTYR